MNKRLSIKEIEKHYQGEWVLLTDPKTDELHQVLEGDLACHSRNVEEVENRLLELRPKHSALFYVGPLPKDVAFAL